MAGLLDNVQEVFKFSQDEFINYEMDFEKPFLLTKKLYAVVDGNILMDRSYLK